MKKFLSVVLLLLTFTVGASAQDVEYKKSWIFTDGLSDETIANLNADAAWADNGTDGEGVVNNWKNVGKPSPDTDLMANGEVIAELKDLKFDIGNNKDNSIHIATTKIRLTRKSTKITFPQLMNGQKITVQGRSANGTATNRGIAPVQSYIQFQAEESSPQTNGACIFLGNQVEGSEGTYTFVWKVVTESTDPVDVQFQLTPDAGIDFTFFMIDQGDAPAVKDAQPVAYLYSGALDDDYAYAYLSGDSRFALTEINVDDTEETAETLLAKQEDGKTNRFDAVVVSPTIAADNANLSLVDNLIAFMPMLNLNPNLYDALGYGTAVKTETNVLTVLDQENAAFEGLEMEEGLPLLAEGGITGVTLGRYFADDAVLATAGETVAMHVHNAKRNAYMLLPLTLEDMAIANQDVIATLIPNALQVVVDTRKDVQAVGTPVITPTLYDGHTTVSITAANSKTIYYTLDGSDPSDESTVCTLYTEPFEIWENGTVVKAYAIGDGYTNSKVAEKEIPVKRTASIPTVTIESNAGGVAVVSLQSPQGIDIFFNFNGATTSALSQKYTEPITLTESCTLYVMAEGGDWLPSDLGSEHIDVEGFNGRIYELSHFDANQTDWFINDPETSGDAAPKASAYYFWGKSAWNYYDTSVEKGREPVIDPETGQQATDPETGDPLWNIIYDPDPNAVKEILPLNDNGWKLRSAGQVLTGELQLAPENGVGNGATGRFADEAIDLITTPTKGCITFGTKQSGEPYTASIETTKKMQAPFDVVVMCGNGNGSGKGVLEIQVSADGQDWTSLGELTLADTQRYIKRTRVSYNASDEVFVRVAQTSGGTKAQVYDIILLNDDESLGVSEVKSDQRAKVVGIYSINGVRTQQLTRGLNIVVNADGSVRKVMSK